MLCWYVRDVASCGMLLMSHLSRDQASCSQLSLAPGTEPGPRKCSVNVPTITIVSRR